MGFKGIFALFLLLLVIPVTTTAGDIWGPTTITGPGTYVLQADILDAASGIQIYSSDVIIEGNGHTIDGLGSSGSGIVIGGTSHPTYSNIEIRNLVLSDWMLGITVPMTASGASDILIKDIEFTIAGYGTRGIYAYAVTDMVIDGCTFTGTPFAAIELPVGAVRPIVRDSHFTGGQYGLLINGLQSAPGKAEFTGNTIENADIGIYANYFSGAMITDNTVKSNQEGIRVGCISDSTITGNTVTGNTENGLSLSHCNSNTIANNYFNNILNVHHYTSGSNTWALPLQAGTNIIGGSYIGGNYWGKPDGTGFSDTAVDSDGDGIADTAYTELYVNDPLPLVAGGQPPVAVPEFPAPLIPLGLVLGMVALIVIVRKKI